MYPPHLSYLKEKGLVWFNPSNGIIEFWNERRRLSEKLGKSLDEVWSHRDFKKAKEIYAISIIAKTMEKQEKVGPWWILKPQNDPPDGVIGVSLETGGGRKMSIREIEVVEHLNGDILDTIRQKLSGKQYEPNTILVCYLSQGGVYDFEEKSVIISKEITSLNHIFLVFPGAKITDIPEGATGDDLIYALFKISVVQIKPIFSYSTISPIDDCKDWMEGKEKNFLISEGFGKGGSSSITLENSPKLF